MMNISFNIERLVPRFLLGDRNGYALAKAIERAFQLAAEAAQRGLNIISDPNQMPEWRLDEMAGELNCLYDFNATLEQKRYWIKNATYLYTIYGTPKAINSFLEGYFQTVDVEEGWQYDGDPFHFRVTVSGPSGEESIAWAQKAIAAVKNVRSVLDGISVDNSGELILTADMDYFRSPYFFDADELTTGDGVENWVQDNTSAVALTDIGLTDEGVTG